MEKDQALRVLRVALAEIVDSRGFAQLEAYKDLRAVDAKRREIRVQIESVAGLPNALMADFDKNPDFEANSRRVRLEALAGYVRSAIKFIETGAVEKPKKIILAPPDVAKLTAALPGLKDEIERRWRDAQKCAHVGAHTAAIIMMGSVLEALLLGRAQMSAGQAYQSPSAPKDRTGKGVAIPDWTLSSLIDVAVDVRWIKADRGKFGHALRDSRNVVHPWHAVSTKADFDEATCKTAWSVLEASVDDLLKSLP
ncbi:hypothetical protein [Dyella sp. C9]|uniref:hypothetical protein n=1 Tax=Dyella sp. C9 TaxID=2202154 RepID=UPI000DEEFC2A|nr:hypothetical protein [Dyella sp. C9]